MKTAIPVFHMMQFLFFGTFFLFPQNIHGQPIDVTKRTLAKIFRENTIGTTHFNPKGKYDKGTIESHRSKYDTWLVCNDDQSYYRKDTLVLHNHMYAYFEMNCRHYTGWYFFKHKNRKLFNLTSFDAQTSRDGPSWSHCYWYPSVHIKNSEVFITLKDPCFNQDEFKVRWDDVDHVIRRDSNATRHETEVFKVIDLHRTLHRGIEGDWKYVMTIVRQYGK